MANGPAMQATSGSFLRTWIDALTKPREDTYAAIGTSPKAKATTGYVWVFVTSIIASLVAVLAQGAIIQQQLENSGVALEEIGGKLGSLAIGLICGAPFAAIFGTLMFAVWTAIVQWIARMFGGKGTNDQLAYTLAAIGAPYSLASAVLILLAGIPYVGFCFNILAGLGGLYVLVLNIMAIKSVNRFGYGSAIGAYLIPALVVLLVCCALFAVVVTVAGIALGDVFSTITQSLVP